MVTLDYIRSIEAQFEPIPIKSRETILSERLTELHAAVPEWNGWNQPDDVEYKIQEYSADREYRTLTAVSEAIKQSMLAFATDNKLDVIVAAFGIRRKPGESDDAMRMRTIRRFLGSSAGHSGWD